MPKATLNKNNIWLMTLYVLVSAILLPTITSIPIVALIIGDIPLIMIFCYIFRLNEDNGRKSYFDSRIRELLIGLVCGITVTTAMIKDLATYSLSLATENIWMFFLLHLILLIPILLIFNKMKKQ